MIPFFKRKFLLFFNLGLLILWGGISCHASTSNIPYYIVRQELKSDSITLGALIDKKPTYYSSVMASCLYDLAKPTHGILSQYTADEILSFFETHDLVRHIKMPDVISGGKTKTFNHLYGVEFPDHGPLSARVNLFVKKLIETKGNINYLDIGGGYGSFVNKVIVENKDLLDHLSITMNDCLSVQCYHAANCLKEWKQVKYYPRNILVDITYSAYKLDVKFHIATCFNVHDFMSPSDFESAHTVIYDIIEDKGYYIASAHSPYSLGEDSPLAKEYERRKAQGQKFPGYFIEEEFRRFDNCLELLNVRLPVFLLTPEDYAEILTKKGFYVEEKGYFAEDQDDTSRKFSYVIAKKNSSDNNEASF